MQGLYNIYGLERIIYLVGNEVFFLDNRDHFFYHI